MGRRNISNRCDSLNIEKNVPQGASGEGPNARWEFKVVRSSRILTLLVERRWRER